jgi:hypothetical protein
MNHSMKHILFLSLWSSSICSLIAVVWRSSWQGSGNVSGAASGQQQLVNLRFENIKQSRIKMKNEGKSADFLCCAHAGLASALNHVSCKFSSKQWGKSLDALALTTELSRCCACASHQEFSLRP